MERYSILGWPFDRAFQTGMISMWWKIWTPGKPGRKFLQFVLIPGEWENLPAWLAWGVIPVWNTLSKCHPKILNFSILGPHRAKIWCPSCCKSNSMYIFWAINPVLANTNPLRPFPRGPGQNINISWAFSTFWRHSHAVVCWDLWLGPLSRPHSSYYLGQSSAPTSHITIRLSKQFSIKRI